MTTRRLAADTLHRGAPPLTLPGRGGAIFSSSWEPLVTAPRRTGMDLPYDPTCPHCISLVGVPRPGRVDLPRRLDPHPGITAAAVVRLRPDSHGSGCFPSDRDKRKFKRKWSR